MSRSTRSRLTTHLLNVAAYIVGFFWLAFVWAALKVLSTPETGNHSHLVGLTILIVAVGVMIATMDRWVRYLPVILGGFVLGALVALGAGHLLNGRPFPRLIAATLATLALGCSLTSGTLARRKLEIFDRLALVGFLVAVIGGFFQDTPIAGLVGFTIGLTCLLAAWARNRYLSSKNKSKPASE